MSAELSSTLHGKPLIYGEVLFDIFPDGKKVLGGAPFNVAWHLQGFGLGPLFISRIGHDSEGQEILDAMNHWGMDTRGLQHDRDHVTGGVEITMAGTDHTFDIRPDQAYDHINYTPLNEFVHAQDFSLIYHGSLIARNTVSRETLEHLINEIRIPVFVDVNLRDPWWDAATVADLLQRARWVKLNHEELAVLVPTTHNTEADLKRAADEALSRFELDALVVTRGADGAFIATSHETAGGKPPPVDKLVDTVGAGDAFCAVTIFGLHQGWSATEINERALTFASVVCEQRGATQPDRDLYAHMLSSWNAV